MASTRATNALKSYIAQSVARNETVTFDKIIFAHISGLNDATLANINNMPTVDQIKHTANIQQTGYIADDQVVYSVTLGSEIGDFTFNFVGLINSANNVLGVAIYTGDIVKTRTKAEEQGNALTRNIILQVNNAKTLTNIQTQAKAWQFDFTDKFLQMKPKKITATTTNTADSSGHTHEIEKASTTQSGIVQLVDDWTTHDNRKALTASVGKRLYDTLKGLIDNLSNTAANALSKTTPKKITASTTNTADQNGHTHEIDKASTSIAGVVKLNDTLTSNATDEALTARQGKVLDEKIQNSLNQVKQEVIKTKPLFENIWEGWHGRIELNGTNTRYDVAIQKFNHNGQMRTEKFSTWVQPLRVNIKGSKGIIYITCVISAGGGNEDTKRMYSFLTGFEGFIGADRYGGENADRNYANVIYVKPEGDDLIFYIKGGEHYAAITKIEILKLG